ncbi:hypothetical protein Scep_011982 [Stephania cephalantha]|uniref:Uncharacterized protein n=1 Tax=Stephania cephalantha TaxID=152367 RepID=A0AAP0JED8_9MAGN
MSGYDLGQGRYQSFKTLTLIDYALMMGSYVGPTCRDTYLQTSGVDTEVPHLAKGRSRCLVTTFELPFRKYAKLPRDGYARDDRVD